MPVPVYLAANCKEIATFTGRAAVLGLGFLPDGVAISIKYCRTVTAVWFIQWDKKGSCSGKFLQKFVGVVFTSIVNNHQSGISLVVMTFHYWVPLVNGFLNILRFIICRNYDI